MLRTQTRRGTSLRVPPPRYEDVARQAAPRPPRKAWRLPLARVRLLASGEKAEEGWVTTASCGLVDRRSTMQRAAALSRAVLRAVL